MNDRDKGAHSAAGDFRFCAQVRGVEGRKAKSTDERMPVGFHGGEPSSTLYQNQTIQEWGPRT